MATVAAVSIRFFKPWIAPGGQENFFSPLAMPNYSIFPAAFANA
jgi:hypothetical protein